eukprot:Transcript_7767.p1 GENE.Transcript_7767~~Transcript_7767.p1  ORF type:complete len:314 (+),score=41.06 Transcript_7767:709-1650(+)
MADLHHPGVLALMGAGETPDRKPFVVLQQLKETLASTLPRSGSSYFAREAALKRWSLTRALQCGLELADALRYLHDEAISGFFILHRDIKPDNLGFLADGKLVLFDFGLAKLCKVDPNEAPGAGRTLTGEVGTPRYMAPEVACSRPYGVAAETYSFSILLWQMASHELPFCGLDWQSFLRVVAENGQRPPLKKSWTPQLCALLAECWQAAPASRPSMAQVCAQLREIINVLPPESPRRSPGASLSASRAASRDASRTASGTASPVSGSPKASPRQLQSGAEATSAQGWTDRAVAPLSAVLPPSFVRRHDRKRL